MKQKKLLIPILLILTISLFPCNSEKDKTQILVIGTIHGNHEKNLNYTYQDIVNILGAYNPEAICVEIPPSYFRKRSYLKEMMIASIYGFENNKKVYPIDWWSSGNDRSKQLEFRKTEEYKIKEKQVSKMVKANTIMQNFKIKYGSLNSIWRKNEKGYSFFNGKEYNDYVREMYGISMAVYGDGFMNLHYETRNGKMMELIDSAIVENKGKRIIILAGAEHKHYFDIALSKREDLNVLDFKEILPLKESQTSKNLTEFIEKNLAKGYYDVSDSSSIDIMYHGALIPLIHGLGMDDDPNIIPIENIGKAKSVIAEWTSYNPNSVYLQFEKGWIEFLEKDYNTAISTLQTISNRLDEIPQNEQWFVKTFYYRNLGFCYDMIGQREKAIQSYEQCKDMCNELNINKNYAKTIYKNYDKEPYNRENK